MKRRNLQQISLKNKLKELKQKRLKVGERKGITLIALVITIIVLLILAGVSIATLTGENGILTKANEAKTKTQKSGAYEQVQVQVLGSMGTDGKVNVEELNENLRNNIPGLTYNGKPITAKSEDGGLEEGEENRIKELPAIVVVDEYKIKIEGNGTVTLLDGITAEDLTEDTYGEYVNYGIDINGDGDTTKDWRIFYIKDYDGEGENAQTNPQTGKRIFIIASDYVGNTCKELTGATNTDENTTAGSNTEDCAMSKSKLKQATGNSGSLHKDCCYYWSSSNIPTYECTLPSEGKTACAFPKLFEFSNYDIKKHASTSGSSTQYENSKCAASLLCTGNWSKFVTTGGEYSIGGPTLEMWVNSWNKKEASAKNFHKLYALPRTDSTPYGYYVGTTKGATSIYIGLSSVGENGTDGREGTGYYDTLYFPHRTTDAGDLDKDEINEYEYGYWLASPSARNSGNSMRVGYEGNVDGSSYGYSCLRFASGSLSKI